MKRKLIVTLEYEEEWDETDPDCAEYNDYNFVDWRDCDYDNVDRPLEHMLDVGWKITKTKVK